MRTDILLNANDDLDIAAGDWAVGSSAMQETDLLVTSQKGEWKQNPTSGFGISRYLKKRIGASTLIDSMPRFIRDLKLELQNDGQTNPTLNISPDLSVFEIKVDE